PFLLLFFLYGSGDLRDLHSFPTRRSSDLGPKGLAGGKRVIVALSRGGLYGAGAPAAAFEHAESYLKAAFGFIGITPEFVLAEGVDRKSTRLNSSHDQISYAVFCLKKKKNK